MFRSLSCSQPLDAQTKKPNSSKEMVKITLADFPYEKLMGLLPTEWVESASNVLQVLFYQGLATYGSL